MSDFWVKRIFQNVIAFVSLALVGNGQTEIPIETRVIGTSDYAVFPGCGRICLTFDGKHALVLWKRGRASSFDVESLKETSLNVNPYCVGIRSNCQQDGYFAFTVVEDARTERLGLWKHGASFQNGGEMSYFADLESLKEWTPTWTFKFPNAGGFQFFQIPGSKLVALIAMHKNLLPERDVVLIDLAGKVVGKFEVKGSILGIEQLDDLEIYFAGPTDLPYDVAIHSARLNKRYKISEIKTLYVLNLEDYCRQWGSDTAFRLLLRGNLRDASDDLQMFRVRGVRPGDAKKFVSEILPQSGYFPNDPFARDRVYRNSLVNAHLQNLNQVAAFESESNFEFMRFEDRTADRENSPTFWNRNGDVAFIGDKYLGRLNQLFYVSDAVVDGNGGIVVHSKVIHANDANQATIAPRRELGISYFGNRIPESAVLSK